ncbi:ATP-binding cassette domain-containing protein [Streptomyces sp. VNUA24]|uniref:ABC transporter permease subunit n=1 Tax=Streptomyces sp. VNUA24 TaxID=3031131 RepID=UPI0023B84278|nr:ATP-binding cassette domain-containing protein [Streptomyces sp. VNUA24]WEH19091.1 ATP-binding cassette domain-containing protein [Streptomyces sp. VNUA24]
MASLTYDLTLAGLSVGSAAALTGIGLIVTYRATGVLNFAHGAIAMVCAYLLRQCTVEWGWPLWLGTLVTLLLAAPALGLALERLVFRPLAVLGGDPAQSLVASLGVFVLLVGGAVLVWGPGARDDAPTLVPGDPWGQLAVVVAVAAAVGTVTRRTRFGRELRAVVDDRSLAVLAGVDADRVAAAGWAFGSFTAGLTGVLLAPYVRLDPYGMPLLVMEVVAVAVAARMRSLPVAVLVALGIGVAQSQLTRFHPPGWAEPLLQAVGANLFVVALLVAALVLPGVGGRDTLPRPAPARGGTPAGVWIVALALFLLPLGFAGGDLHTAVQVPALGVILLSLVVVTGRGGQISLGQAAYAGLGALFTALLSAGRLPFLPALPELTALLVAVLLVAPLGLLTGGPAVRRHGLALALATFAVGVGVSRFVFAQPYAASGPAPTRPAGFEGDRAYYALELVLLLLALLATRALRRGRTGRALAALRDHEPGASAAGVRVPSLKLAAFVAGAALAALGGGMLAMGVRAFDPAAFDPVRGLLWFAAIVVLGADSTLGALAAAALLVGLDAGTKGGVAAALIGLLAALVGRFPGGLQEALARLRAGPGHRHALTPTGVRARQRVRAGRASGGDAARAGRGAPLRAAEARGTPGTTEAERGVSGAPPPPRAGNEPGPAHAERPAGTGTTGTAPGTPATPEAGQGEPRTAGVGRGGSDAPPPPPPPQPPQTGNTPGVARTTGPAGTEPGTDAGADADADEGAVGSPTDGPGAPRPAARGGERPGTPSPPPRSGTDPGTGTGVGPAPPGARTGAPSSAVALQARRLRVGYGGLVALDGVDLDVHPGRVGAVVGPNGAGKSTLFHCLAGTLRPGEGRVRLGGRDVTRLPAHARTRLGIARTFQQLAVFPSLTVAENVRVGAEQGRVSDPAAAERALRLFGLDGAVRTAPAAGLPTGTLRRVELARALAGSPRVLLLDEPAAGLDTAEVAALARVLRALADDGTALLVVEHDLDLVADLADVVHVMAAGRIVASGPPGHVLRAPGPLGPLDPAVDR